MYLTDIREENIRILMKGGSVLYIQYQSLRVSISPLMPHYKIHTCSLGPGMVSIGVRNYAK